MLSFKRPRLTAPALQAFMGPSPTAAAGGSSSAQGGSSSGSNSAETGGSSEGSSAKRQRIQPETGIIVKMNIYRWCWVAGAWAADKNFSALTYRKWHKIYIQILVHLHQSLS